MGSAGRKKLDLKEKHIAIAMGDDCEPSSLRPPPPGARTDQRSSTTNRLSKILAGAGVASRRASEEIIGQGRVAVNGKIVTVPQTPVDPTVDAIFVDGEPLRTQELTYILLNKPKGFVCTAEEGRQKRVIDLFGNLPERLFTVGRLDKETTGLLLLTNDGHFAQRVIHPSSRIEKEYLAKVVPDVTGDHLEVIRKGALVDEKWVKPRRTAKIRKGTVKITVMEGRKHEVRILLQNAGLKVLELSRIRIGNLRLGSLPVGAYKSVSLNTLESSIFLNPTR